MTLAFVLIGVYLIGAGVQLWRNSREDWTTAIIRGAVWPLRLAAVVLFAVFAVVGLVAKFVWGVMTG